MPETEIRFQKRQVAHKVGICDVLKGDFIKDELSAGYIKLNDSMVSRVNVIAVIVDKSEAAGNSSVIIDDGTGRILLKSFDGAGLFSGLDVGDVVLTVGRIREFNSERYIVPELLKKTGNTLWMAARKLELEKRGYLREAGKDANAADRNIDVSIDLPASDEIYSLIKDLDNGEGVSFDEIIGKFKGSEAENAINKLLENGNIFEIRPGRLKVLE
ncbi:hypothetical protein J4480_00150 [Candidatus Woesearchaeota archaeon]|nr:hypothetical protein [Candidatus Woesearchaeota archaeon]